MEFKVIEIKEIKITDKDKKETKGWSFKAEAGDETTSLSIKSLEQLYNIGDKLEIKASSKQTKLGAAKKVDGDATGTHK